MLDLDAIIAQIDAMSADEVDAMVQKALDESGISYSVGDGTIEWDEVAPLSSSESGYFKIALSSSGSSNETKYTIASEEAQSVCSSSAEGLPNGFHLALDVIAA